MASVVLGALVFAGSRAVGPLPALGAFLEPAHGVWALARTSEMPRDASAAIRGLSAPVRVEYDDRAVPHIFAASEDDAYRALGYVVARDRMFQLYIQTLAATGRLTEVAGARALELDREMRRLGLPRSAEREQAALPATDGAARVAAAYAEGVNAWIESMPASALPLEFRLLGTRPERWSAINSLHLQNRMGYTLAYLSLEGDRMAAAAVVGEAAADALFPDDSPLQEPLQPTGGREPRENFHPLPPPGAPDSASALASAMLDALMPSQRLARAATDADGEPRWQASNNWAVAPRRSASGHALLAGDPHLELTLPSIWYEAHLVVPGTLDVYGVTIPGAPGIVIGFNRDVAWTFTNTGADVLDLYAEQVDDVAHPARYRLDGAWRPLERRSERYLGKHGETLATDTTYYTHRGPMRRAGERWLSMRWTVLEGTGREVTAFRDGAHARSAREFEEAMGASYAAPAQNMLAADRGGHIAIRSTGRFPVRPAPGDGGHVRDGRTSASDWTSSLAVSGYPQSFDPAQGFLASANQQPADPRTTTTWMGGVYDPWRALRINTLLRADSALTPDAMRRMQRDPGSARADLFVPYFLNAARRLAHPGDTLAEAARLLAEWDRRYTLDNQRAVLFEAAMRELAERTWDELRASRGTGARAATPSTAVLAELLADSASVWWDDRATPRRETRDEIVAAALVAALRATRERYGAPDAGGWRWNRIRKANVSHLLRLSALSALGIPVQGGPGTLSPSSGSGNFGPSWRMVVELGDEPRAWATYPGGQSGNPVSARYRDRLPVWTEGRLEPVRLPRAAGALGAAQRSALLRLEPAR